MNVRRSRIALYAGMVSLLASAAIVVPTRNVDGWLALVRRAAPADEATQAAVVEAVLEQRARYVRLVREQSDSRYVVVVDTVAGCTTPAGCAGMRDELSILQTDVAGPDLRRAFADSNRSSRRMRIAPIAGFDQVGAETIAKLSPYDRMRGRESVDWVMFSWAAVAADRKHAVLSVSSGCNFLICGSGSVVLLVKGPDGWRLEKSEMTWIT